MSFRDKTGTALSNLLESQGDDGAQLVIEDMLENKKITPEDFSLKEVWEQCTQWEFGERKDVREAVASGAFPKITGTLISSKLISAYDGVTTIGDKLTTVNQSNMQIETIAGFSEAETPEEVGEGMEYSDSTIGEKFVTAQNVKYGRMISVTEEMIYFDKTGQVLNRAKRVGQKAAQYKERLILRGIQDLDGTVYRPDGNATAFYALGSAASHKQGANLIQTNPFGEAGLEEVMNIAQTMKDDSEGAQDDDYINIDLNSLMILVPALLYVEAWQMANSAKTPESGENAENFFKGRFTPVTSPYITSNNATTWYWGDFKEDFWWNEVWPLQTMTQKPGGDHEFTKDIKARVKVRFYGSCSAVSYVHCFKNTT